MFIFCFLCAADCVATSEVCQIIRESRKGPGDIRDIRDVFLPFDLLGLSGRKLFKIDAGSDRRDWCPKRLVGSVAGIG